MRYLLFAVSLCIVCCSNSGHGEVRRVVRVDCVVIDPPDCRACGSLSGLNLRCVADGVGYYISY